MKTLTQVGTKLLKFKHNDWFQYHFLFHPDAKNFKSINTTFWKIRNEA